MFRFSLHKKWSFPLRISSVNVTKSEVPADLVTFTEEILHGKLHFLYSVYLASEHCYYKNAIRPTTGFNNEIIKKLFKTIGTLKSFLQFVVWSIAAFCGIPFGQLLLKILHLFLSQNQLRIPSAVHSLNAKLNWVTYMLNTKYC